MANAIAQNTVKNTTVNAADYWDSLAERLSHTREVLGVDVAVQPVDIKNAVDGYCATRGYYPLTVNNYPFSFSFVNAKWSKDNTVRARLLMRIDDTVDEDFDDGRVTFLLAFDPDLDAPRDGATGVIIGPLDYDETIAVLSNMLTVYSDVYGDYCSHRIIRAYIQVLSGLASEGYAPNLPARIAWEEIADEFRAVDLLKEPFRPAEPVLHEGSKGYYWVL